MSFLKNKRALIIGILNQNSIAYGIAKSMQREGAELALTYQGEQVKERVEKAALELGVKIVLPCDLSVDEQITELFLGLKKHWDGFDILVHSAAYAPKDQLDGNYLDCINREGFRIAHDVSSYSFAAAAKAAHLMMQGRKGALVTISYLGAERAVPNYNVMGLAKASLEANVRYLAASLGPEGIRVNGISAGAIKTLAASAVKNLKRIFAFGEKVAPLRKNVTQEEVGDTAAFLCSDLASGITGEIIHVDAGLSIVGAPGLDLM